MDQTSMEGRFLFRMTMDRTLSRVGSTKSGLSAIRKCALRIRSV